jgi:hypothetical protein
MDYLIIRVVEKTNENWASLEQATLDYLIKLNESLDINQYVDKHLKDQETRLLDQKQF